MIASDIQALGEKLKTQIGRGIIGQSDAVDLLLIALFSKGHILLEGPPGTAKTFLARCFSACLSMEYGRIQFTPDLMPGDVLGTNFFNFQTSQFLLTKGPIFTELLLADEINRTPPKTQAALLEAMQERRITIDGETHILSDQFMVVATQNPIEQQGTYPLPEAQLDRFLFKHEMAYPSAEEEFKIVASHALGTGAPSMEELGIQSVVTREELNAACEYIGSVKLSDEVIDYTIRLVRATRDRPHHLDVGVSPRAAVAIAVAARARAALNGRDYVIPDDVKELAAPAMCHRVVLSASAEIEGRTAASIIADIIAETEAPR
ncbi:MoxR family ATPase [Ponticaulis sp.]|uniref:AAA family ATPase n=1 Tax=Ponticaulis sp. TaxID=2020902 RepID=UPI000B723812|nr:MoxR family ATPase [Ponticaulis sp.]MAI88953.1 magnesium chelatase [Ponticaulis sp.]OUY01640.1 MAG: magnesium chelatase [Hyphomonadaceae bacterium TMED5]|tara:strand:+ start:74122 stop:75081 length:960 start_codon:yes stop_codon:yes gene_type:complete